MAEIVSFPNLLLSTLGLEKILQFSAELNPTDVKADYSIRMKMKKLITVYDKVNAGPICWKHLGEVSLENPVNYPKVAINECFNSVCFFSYYFNSLSYVILDCVVNVRSSMTAQFSWIFADEYSWVLFNCGKRKQSCGCCWMFPCTFFWKVGLK